ncbi:hypothetical protein Barb6XT_00691 [Bacteroidales bacterium Barb6XT]|nr:hypothetical protein Barb6XT_00691 [Bacteroidales bacterium Barb6XT]
MFKRFNIRVEGIDDLRERLPYPVVFIARLIGLKLQVDGIRKAAKSLVHLQADAVPMRKDRLTDALRLTNASSRLLSASCMASVCSDFRFRL